MSRNPFEVKIPKYLIGTTKKSTSKRSKKRQLTSAQKIFAWENKSHICNICGKRVTKLSDAEFDHTRAYSKSGASNLSNVKIVHRLCNRLKGKKSLSETKRILGIKSKTKKGSKKKPMKKKRPNKRVMKKSSNLFEVRIPSFRF